MALSFELGAFIPFVALVVLHRAGTDILIPLYAIAVLVLLISSLLLLVRGRRLLHREPPLMALEERYPPATAIVIPNGDDSSLLGTVEAVLGLTYPAAIQVLVLHYPDGNSMLTRNLEVMTSLEPRLQAMLVDQDGVEQGIREALQAAQGEMVGLFRGGDVPNPDSFTRAWYWIHAGYDAVCGHQSLRNGGVSLVSRLVAVEGEALRAGATDAVPRYWRTEVARQQPRLLTPDLRRGDATGIRVASDPRLVCWERGPSTFGGLWGTQVQSQMIDLRGRAMPGGRDRLESFALSIWRPLAVWLRLLVPALVVYWIWQASSLPSRWSIAIVGMVILWVLETGLLPSVFAYRLAPTEMRRHRSWFLLHGLTSPVVLAPLLNTGVRTAHLWSVLGARTRVISAPAEVEQEPFVSETGPPISANGWTDTAHPASLEEAGEPVLVEALIAAPEPSVQGEDQMTDQIQPRRDEGMSGPRAMPLSQGSNSNARGQAVEAAERLAQMVRELVRELDERDAERQRLQRDIQSLEDRVNTTMPQQQALVEAVRSSVPADEIQTLHQLLNSLIENPNHIVILASLSQHAAALGQILDGYVRIQRVLQSTQTR